jgi:hypothetical protein
MKKSQVEFIKDELSELYKDLKKDARDNMLLVIVSFLLGGLCGFLIAVRYMI